MNRKFSGGLQQVTTPYLLAFVDLAATGPLVVEPPAGPTAGGVSDFWQREIGVMGEMGPEKGEGGRYLIVPPGAQPPPDAGDFLVLPSTGVHVMCGLRTLDPDPVRAKALVDAVRIYPYGQRDSAPRVRILSPGGRPWSGDQPRGLEFWERLHGIYRTEVVDERDRFFLAMLRQLGIEKGRPFAPDERLTRILTAATAAGELMAQANSFAKPRPRRLRRPLLRPPPAALRRNQLDPDPPRPPLVLLLPLLRPPPALLRRTWQLPDITPT